MNKLTISVALFSILAFSSTFAQSPEPYRSLNILPFDPQGWFGNGEPLEACLKQKPAKVIVEIGSWLGCSTRFIASTISDDGMVYAVDTWQGSLDEEIHQQDPRLSFLYQQFLSNVVHAGLTDKIIPVRMKSTEAAKALNVQADLIYIDGAHDTHSVCEDILAWHPHLVENGIMCGDDWLWDSVRVAVIHCSYILNKQVHSQGNFWWYE